MLYGIVLIRALSAAKTSTCRQNYSANWPRSIQSPVELLLQHHRSNSSVAILLTVKLRPYQSIVTSKGTYIDCIILHAPLPTLANTLEAWEALSSFVPLSVRALGVSNITLRVLNVFCRRAVLKVSVVQNCFHPATDYEGPLSSARRRILYIKGSRL